MIVGTAGHVDHGKTTLVRALTGVDTDRLKEEKRRGITIELGFAYMPGPDGVPIGFVDVPGHESLVRTMVAGVHGIDLALLVVAADEGVKPQTREHVEILRLLGLNRGIVVVTKSDRADDARRTEVRADLAAALALSPLARETPLFVSCVTGQGLEALHRRLADEAAVQTRMDGNGIFRLVVDRSFSLKGVGTVVAGAALGGRITVDDTVTVMPSHARCRVRSIHVQHQPAQVGAAGDRCALALVGVPQQDAPRGAWICGEREPFETARIDVELHLSRSETKALKQQTPVHFHCGASDIAGRTLILASETLQPGSDALAQIALSKPLPLRHGDRFVLRDTSGSRTIGGGKVVDVRPPNRRRRSPERLVRLAAMRETMPDKALRDLLDGAPGFENLNEFAADRSLSLDQARGLVDRLGLCPIGAPASVFVTTSAAKGAFEQAIVDRLFEVHRDHPDLPGLAAERLRTSVVPILPSSLFAAIVAGLVDARCIAQSGPWLRLPTHVARLSDEDRRIADAMLPLFDEAPFRPPRVRDVGAALAFHETQVRHACKALVRSGALIEIAHDHFFRREAVVEMARIAQDLTTSSADGRFTAAAFRNRLDNGRKVTIQILEYFDRHGLTRRSGDLRTVVKAAELLFGDPGRSDGPPARISRQRSVERAGKASVGS